MKTGEGSSAAAVNELARRAGLNPHTPGLTIECAAIVLGVRGAKTRALEFWRRGAVDIEVARIEAVHNDGNHTITQQDAYIEEGLWADRR